MNSNNNNSNNTVSKGLVGSGHIYSMGYGYGARVPTARNAPTLPASIPQYRYPPVSERSENYFRSRPMGLTGYKADKRLVDQIIHQTSGDWGKFLTVNDNADIRLFMKPVPATISLNKSKNATVYNDDNNNKTKKGDSNSNNNNNTYRESKTSSRYDFNDSSELTSHRDDINSNSGNSKYHATLSTIDFKSFPKHAKYNLRAAVQAPVPEHVYRGVATNNQLGYKNCLNWSGQLRG